MRGCCDDFFNMMDLSAVNACLFVLTVFLVSVLTWLVYNRGRTESQRDSDETTKEPAHFEEQKRKHIDSSEFIAQVPDKDEQETYRILKTEENESPSFETKEVADTVSIVDQLSAEEQPMFHDSLAEPSELDEKTKLELSQSDTSQVKEATPLLITLNSQEELELEMKEATNEGINKIMMDSDITNNDVIGDDSINKTTGNEALEQTEDWVML